MASKAELSRRAKLAWETRKKKTYEKKKVERSNGFSSHETSAYVRFLLYLASKCQSCNDGWSMGKSYKSDNKKFFGYRDHDE